MMNILEIRNLIKTYQSPQGSFNALDGVSLDIKQGEILGLLGVNGAGKTTLSSILATLHPPTSGDVLFKGTSIYGNIMHYRTALGFCPQRQNLDTHLNVQENLLFAGRYFLLPEDVVRQRTHALMETFDLLRYAAFDINSLSGGTKQRVLIARALMHNPEIVLLDEPTVGLDPDVRRRLWQHIKTLKERGITVILTTHYLDEAEILSDRICILNRGQVLLTTSIHDLKETHPHLNLEEIFIKLTDQTHQESDAEMV